MEGSKPRMEIILFIYFNTVTMICCAETAVKRSRAGLGK